MPPELVVSLLKFLFWLSSLLVIYPYILYPMFLYVACRVRGQSPMTVRKESDWPSVTLVISAFNESDVIADKLKNSLELNYPFAQLQIVVVSDASDDGTDTIVEQWATGDSRISLFRQDTRHGKTAGINGVMQTLDSEIVIFSDANAIYDFDALRELVRHFDSESVGYVVGSALYVEDSNDAVKDSEGLYWRYELWIKELESAFHSVVGGDGAIYAIRKELYWSLQDSDINDFVNPLQIVAKGFRGVFTREARCFEYASDEFSKEFGRKRRIVNRSWRAVRTYRHLFSLQKHGWFLFMLMSHKVIRWFSMFFIVAACLSCALLLTIAPSLWYAFYFVVIMLSMVLAFMGKWMDARNKSMSRLFYLPYYFYFVNLASILGIWDDTRGVRHVTWGHIRR